MVDHVRGSGRRIALTLLTHGHLDHAESAERFHELTGAPVRGFGRGHDDVREGEVITVGGLEILAVPTPGHTSDSFSFVLPADNTLLTGDTVLGRGHLGRRLARRQPRGLPRIPLSHRVAHRESGSVTSLLPGHGPTVDDAAATVTFYLQHRAERLDQVRDAVARGARTAHDVVETVYADVPRSVWPAAEQSVQAQLEYLAHPPLTLLRDAAGRSGLAGAAWQVRERGRRAAREPRPAWLEAARLRAVGTSSCVTRSRASMHSPRRPSTSSATAAGWCSASRAPRAPASRLSPSALVDAVSRAAGPEWVAHVPMDGFHLADVQLDRLGLRSRKGAPETFDAEGYAALLRRLVEEPESCVYAPGFERTLEQPLAAAVVVPPEARLVVTEGNYLLLPEARWQRARAALTEVWFVTGDDDQRRSRLVERHVTFGKDPDDALAWVERTDEANAALVAAAADGADRVVVNGPVGLVTAAGDGRPGRRPPRADGDAGETEGLALRAFSERGA